MPVIPEETACEMDEFVNWDNADPAVGGVLDLSPLGPEVPPLASEDDMGLFFENVQGDDFSFWALEHYAQSTLDPTGPGGDAALPGWETPGAPCANCQKGGFQCKRIREGSYRGYCTSCVALRCECSFGLASDSATFPPNPWPTLGDHPNSIPYEDGIHLKIPHSSTSAPDLTALAADQKSSPKSGPKIGARFSRESVKILKNWLSTHNRHPYPTEEEKETLGRLTGLNKTQITNWLANARRRGKTQPNRSTSPHVRNLSSPIDIPQRRGTPSPGSMSHRHGTPLEGMNPLQRWANSPPENEPASVTDIARAINSSSGASSGLDSPHSFNYTDDGSGRSLCHGSSASSAGTSGSSGGSFASAYSHASRGSFGSFSRGRRRRRRRVTPQRPQDGPNPLLTPLKTFQCTFCTETFRTKHDWQRHEKSLHLSLERWVCAPQGPTAVNPETKQKCCVFCGETNPDEEHIESHNYSACQERSLSDRTFYRKDHLRQHLKLVHDVKFAGWAMEPWKVATPEIQSRCGFCGIVMDTWTIRVDHLAEHFKTGNTMADWKGDWGFEAPVLEMVENSIPPYLIHNERNSPLPYTATSTSPETPRNAYELLRSELVYFIQNRRDAGSDPTDDELQLEACRIVYASQLLSTNPLTASATWLRELIMSSKALAVRAQFLPIRSQAESRMSVLRINGKDNMFEDCPLEHQLREYVAARISLGLTAMDGELQEEACHVIGRMEASNNNPSDEVANFLIRLIQGSKVWLTDFRKRAHLPRSEDLADENQRSKDLTTIDSTVLNYSRLEMELAEYVRAQRGLGIEPDDASLQKQARIIVYEFDDGWNQTAADNIDWLTAFKNRHLPPPPATTSASISSDSPSIPTTSSASMVEALMGAGGKGSGSSLNSPLHDPFIGRHYRLKTTPFFLNDNNCYQRLAKELARYVSMTMSPNNPKSHVPTDEELQHQSRWILYDDDDPWNQTAADNAEWLQRFKRDVGIIPANNGPGLPMDRTSWDIASGGTGFAPPYAFPKAQMEPFQDQKRVQIPLREGARLFDAEPSTANDYLQSFKSRYPAPAAIFCSRELERGLMDYAVAEAAFPSDEALKQKAREILSVDSTAADDDVLLGKFKDMVRAKLAEEQQLPTIQAQTIPELPVGDIDVDVDLNMTEAQMNDILQSMEFGNFGEEMELADGDVALSG